MQPQDLVAQTLKGVGFALPEEMPDPVQWMQDNFYLYDLRQKLTIYEPQERALREALRRDENGRYLYNTVIWSWPKKSAKSTIVAAVVHYICSNKPSASAKLVANDLKQADSRVGAYLRGSIKLNPREKRSIRIKPTNYIIDYPNQSRVEMIPIDPSGEAGGNDDIIVYSELWGWKSTAHQKMWAEMTLSPTKFGNSQRWIDTYAGYEGDSPILEFLYQKGCVEGEQLWPDLEVYANKDARILCVWVTQHLLPWQQGEMGRAYYRSEEQTLPVNEFDRMHNNHWVSSVDTFVAPEWWTACKLDQPYRLHPDQEVVLAVDAGVSSDSFGIVGVVRYSLPGKDGDEVVYTTDMFVREWIPPVGGTVLFSNPEDPEDISTPEGEIRRLCNEYNVIKLVYDKYQMHDMASRLRRDGIVDISAFDQGAKRNEADKLFHDNIRNRSFRHSGDDSLTAHVLNSNKETRGNKMRIIKKASGKKIDLAVCASMANHEATRLNLS